LKREKLNCVSDSARFAERTGANSETFSPMSLRMWGEPGKMEGEPLPMTDNTRMTDGIHKGTRMKDVPAAYLLHRSKDMANVGLTKYVADNHEVLKLEARRDGRLQYKNRRVKR